MDGYILMKAFRGSPKYNHPEPQALKDAVAMIRQRRALAPFPSARYDTVMKVVNHAKEWNLAHSFLEEWRAKHPMLRFLTT